MEGKKQRLGLQTMLKKHWEMLSLWNCPRLRRRLKKGDTVGAVESVKAASDIYSPVTGTIAEVNEALSDKPSLLNKSPEKEGWIFKVEIESEAELDSLMDTEKYAAFVKGQEDKENE